MHELSIAQNIISIVQENINQEQQYSVKRVKVKIGKLTNILVDSLVFGFEALTKETNLDGVVLEVENIPLTIRCKDCETLTSLDDYIFSCPACNSTAINLISGTELMVSEIELND
ncbi:MAG: hydrogenase maturation nickel metallochaperone HypA [bacterium]|nr:MAG: hydrogenase maturation nickel metallochaperone HypA [bacterium]